MTKNRSRCFPTFGLKFRPRKVPHVLKKLAAKFWPWRRVKKSETELDEDGYLERCQWDIITKVDHSAIEEIVRKAVHRQGHRNPAVHIYDTAQGTYHSVIKVKSLSSVSKKLMGWVVKIPGHGTPDRWTKEDEHMLKREAETLELLSEHTKLPSPEVIGYSATLDNEYGFPYIVMEELPGKSATELWYEDHGETPSLETEQKRLVFLRSLARHMTELNNLSFKQIGIPMDPFIETGNFDDIDPDQLPVSKYYVWPFRDSFDVVERGPFTSTQMYIKNSRDEDEVPSVDDDNLTYSKCQKIGLYKILDMVLAHPVFTSTPSDTFALRHSDLDTQNILVDDAGNITGILDWDGSLAMPRCVGHSAVPHFLERDFYPDAADKSLFLSWRAGHYRNLYAAALVEAGNPDAQFTTKSHMYQALFSSLYEGTVNYHDVLIRLLREIPGLQMDTDHLFALVGKGCKHTEVMLQKELWKVLEPQLPAEDLLEKIENEFAETTV